MLNCRHFNFLILVNNYCLLIVIFTLSRIMLAYTRREKACKGTTFFWLDQIFDGKSAIFLQKSLNFLYFFHFATSTLQNSLLFCHFFHPHPSAINQPKTITYIPFQQPIFRYWKILFLFYFPRYNATIFTSPSPYQLRTI